MEHTNECKENKKYYIERTEKCIRKAQDLDDWTKILIKRLEPSLHGKTKNIELAKDSNKEEREYIELAKDYTKKSQECICNK